MKCGSDDESSVGASKKRAVDRDSSRDTGVVETPSRKRRIEGSDDGTGGKRKDKAAKGSPKHGSFISSGGGRMRLPDKLLKFLNEGFKPEVIWWMPDGNGFAYHVETVQSEFLDKCFKGTKLTSFVRSLNRWGFRRVFYHALPEHVVAFYHPKFKRSHPEKVRDITMSPLPRSQGESEEQGALDKDSPGIGSNVEPASAAIISLPRGAELKQSSVQTLPTQDTTIQAASRPAGQPQQPQQPQMQLQPVVVQQQQRTVVAVPQQQQLYSLATLQQLQQQQRPASVPTLASTLPLASLPQVQLLLIPNPSLNSNSQQHPTQPQILSLQQAIPQQHTLQPPQQPFLQQQPQQIPVQPPPPSIVQPTSQQPFFQQQLQQTQLLQLPQQLQLLVSQSQLWQTQHLQAMSQPATSAALANQQVPAQAPLSQAGMLNSAMQHIAQQGLAQALFQQQQQQQQLQQPHQVNRASEEQGEPPEKKLEER